MKVLLIEDEQKTGSSIKEYLQDEFKFEVSWQTDGRQGCELAKTNQYDIIISDIIMPGMDGIGICRELRSLAIRTPILILSALYQPEDKIIGLNAGADDYLAKPFDFGELFARINALVRRNSNPQVNQTRQFADISIHYETLDVFRQGNKINLTPKEFALLDYFIQNKERVIPKMELLEQVWGLSNEINTNVVEVYVNYLRNKLDKSYSKRLIHTHFGVGYILKEE